MSKTNGATKASVPLNSIRVFVEAARTLNFSKAARILGVTQSAISQHVAALEKYLGHRLFVRSGSTVVLTDTGRQYFDTVQEAFSTIELSTRQLALRPIDCRLIVRTSLPTFAMTVLIPALQQFSVQPPVSVDLVTSLSPPLVTDAFDVLLTRDLDCGDDAHWLLASETLLCVVAPALLLRHEGGNVGEWPFIIAQSRPDILSAWANAQAIDTSLIHVNAVFEHYFLAISAAIGGMGYLVVPHILVAEHLRLGHLVDAGFPQVRGDASYKAWVNPHTSKSGAARAFCRWLKGLSRERCEVQSTTPELAPKQAINH